MSKEYYFGDGVGGILDADGKFTYFVPAFKNADFMHQVGQLVSDVQSALKAERDALTARCEALTEVVAALAKFDGRNNITALREMARQALADGAQHE